MGRFCKATRSMRTAAVTVFTAITGESTMIRRATDFQALSAMQTMYSDRVFSGQQ